MPNRSLPEIQDTLCTGKLRAAALSAKDGIVSTACLLVVTAAPSTGTAQLQVAGALATAEW